MDTSYSEYQKSEAITRRKKIKWLRQKKGMSWAQIGRELGISRQRARAVGTDKISEQVNGEE